MPPPNRQCNVVHWLVEKVVFDIRIKVYVDVLMVGMQAEPSSKGAFPRRCVALAEPEDSPALRQGPLSASLRFSRNKTIEGRQNLPSRSRFSPKALTRPMVEVAPDS